MEAMLADYLVLESGAFLGALAALILVIGGVLLGRLADKETPGKRFFWAEWPLPGAEPQALEESDTRQVA
jgi:hypothetical protein